MEEFPYIWIEKNVLSWQEEHFGYHITKSKNIPSILKYGLIPLVGERSKSVNDNIKAIWFFESIWNLNSWLLKLYPEESIENLILLKINLIHQKIFVRDIWNEDFHIKEEIPAKDILYLEIANKRKELQKESEFRKTWQPLLNYKNGKY